MTDAMIHNESATLGTMTIEERARDIAERAGYLRNRMALNNGDAAALHRDAFRVQLDERTTNLVKQDPAALLDHLSELGFAWRDIARMVGVSVPALRRWRIGERPAGENRRAIARLLAFVEILRDDYLVFEPASWMEVPLVADAPTTALDLYVAGQLDVVYEVAAGHCSPEVALDATDPDWREKYRSDWEVGMADDGQQYIRLKPGR